MGDVPIDVKMGRGALLDCDRACVWLLLLRDLPDGEFLLGAGSSRTALLGCRVARFSSAVKSPPLLLTSPKPANFGRVSLLR